MHNLRYWMVTGYLDLLLAIYFVQDIIIALVYLSIVLTFVIKLSLQTYFFWAVVYAYEMGCSRHVNMWNSYCLFCTQKKKMLIWWHGFFCLRNQSRCMSFGRPTCRLLTLITGIWTRRKNFESAATSTVVLWMDSEKNFTIMNDSFLRWMSFLATCLIFFLIK